MRAEFLVLDAIAPLLTDRDVLEISDGSVAFSTAAAEIAASVRCALPGQAARAHAGEARFDIVRMQAGVLLADDAGTDVVVLVNAAALSADLLDEALRVLRPGGLICAAATQPAARAVITDTLMPMVEDRRLACRLSFDANLFCAKIRKPKGEPDA